MITSTILNFNLRYYRRHVLLSLLCLAGISLGVGIVVAVELINKSALTSFESSVDFLAGKADFSIISEQGRIDERAFLKVWENPKVKSASPVIDVMAQTLETKREPVRFLGIDPFLDGLTHGFAPSGGKRSITTFLLRRPAGVYLSRPVMERFGLRTGATLTVLVAGMETKLRVIGEIPKSGVGDFGDNLAVMDLANAQEIFGRIGYLDRIDIVSGSSIKELAEELPADLRITDANARKASLKAMLSSFQLNLAAMSLLALFVGTFLIYNFSMFSVLSRRQDMSLLLTLGSNRRGLVGAFLAESLIFGAAGSFLGIVLGWVSGPFQRRHGLVNYQPVIFPRECHGCQSHVACGGNRIGRGLCGDTGGHNHAGLGSGHDSADSGNEEAVH